MELVADLEGAAPPDLLFSCGYRGQFGYSSANRGKCPDPGYGGRLVAAGGIYSIVFENGAQRALDGYNAGCVDALFANVDADHQAVPLWVLIWWTADFPARWSDVKEYARGWHDTSKRPLGCYGDGEIIRAAKAAGYIKRGWRTCSGGFPGSGGLPHPDQPGFQAAALAAGYDVVQVCGGEPGLVPLGSFSADTNYIVADTIDAWGQQPGDEPLSAAEVQQIVDAVNAHTDQKAREILTGIGQLLGADEAAETTMAAMIRSMFQGNYGESPGFAHGDLSWLDRHLVKNEQPKPGATGG